MEVRALKSVFGVLFLIGACIVMLEYYLAQPEIAPLLDDGKLTDAQNVAINHLIALVELIMNWTLGLLSALSLSIGSILNKQEKFSYLTIVFPLITFFACVISIWLATFAIDGVIVSLALEQDPLKNETIHLTRRWQFLLFVLAITTFVTGWIIQNDSIVNILPNKK